MSTAFEPWGGNPPFPHETLRRRFTDLLENLGAPWDKTQTLTDQVWVAYTGPKRHYHNLEHIASCVAELPVKDRPELAPKDVQAAELALWFHDIVYDPKSKSNEEESVAFLKAQEEVLGLTHHSVAPGVFNTACQAIMATCHKAVPKTPIDKMVVDIDLSILSAPVAEFDTYEKAVRQEYAFVEDAAWRIGRTQILQSFLDREWIYSTQSFRKREADARNNLKRSIAKLAT